MAARNTHPPAFPLSFDRSGNDDNVLPEYVGEIAGYPPGSWFANRKDLSDSYVHRPPMGGISGNGVTGALSIVASGGYEDDVELEGELIYTGQGGRDSVTGKQIADQQLTRGNLALAKNHVEGIPVRVIKGSTKEGYTYDGLYSVADYWVERGQSGFNVYRYRLVKLAPDEAVAVPPAVVGNEKPERKESTILRIVRDTAVSRHVKALYDSHCQVCGITIETPAGNYAEGAHIQPLGRPHNGPDVLENILCLCPNHHVLFDNRGFSIAEDLTLIGVKGSLTIHPQHSISAECTEYHRIHRYG